VSEEELRFIVTGRPAPQGSKEYGDQGQLLEASKYLPSWRRAIKKAVYQRYYDLGIDRKTLPYFRGPVEFGCIFILNTGQRIDSPPDLDKLLRAVWDALTQARVWEDDGRVVRVRSLAKLQAGTDWTGADITIYGQRGVGNESASA